LQLILRSALAVSLFMSTEPTSRRKFLVQGGLALGAVGGAGLLYRRWAQASSSPMVNVSPANSPTAPIASPYDPMQVLRSFDSGKMITEQGRSIRQFELTANSLPIQLNAATSYVAWAINQRLPGDFPQC
jgi:manganese oxidase